MVVSLALPEDPRYDEDLTIEEALRCRLMEERDSAKLVQFSEGPAALRERETDRAPSAWSSNGQPLVGGRQLDAHCRRGGAGQTRKVEDLRAGQEDPLRRSFRFFGSLLQEG